MRIQRKEKEITRIDSYSLKEVCAACGVSRRAVQGYEKMGLVSPSGRTKNGHLLYDGNRQRRIAEIRRWQELGFSLREIRELIDAEPEVRDRALEKQIRRLREQKNRMDELIEMAGGMMSDEG